VTRFRVGGDELVVVSEPTVRATDFPTLSEAERDVAFLATSGYSNKAIAARRGSHQLTAIYRKLGVSSRAEMVARLLDSLAERRRRKGGP
jgi:DNA-binding CsgD family transcriptional regulator